MKAADMRAGMLVKGGGLVFFTLEEWKKAGEGTRAWYDGWNQQVMLILVLENPPGVNKDKTPPYTTELYFREEDAMKDVEILWEKNK